MNMIESLENRQLFAGITITSPDYDATVYVKATGGDDFVILSATSKQVSVFSNSGVKSYNFALVKKVKVSLYSGNDHLQVVGSIPADVDGAAGNDSMFGGAGNDTLRGGAGNDRMNGGGGNKNVFWGGDGWDLVDYAGQKMGVYVTLNDASDDGALYGGDDNVHSDVEGVLGTQFADTFHGNNKDNYFDGRGGNDLIWGWGGNDRIYGGAGNDYIYAGDGADKVYVGNEGGADSVYVDRLDYYEIDQFDRVYRKGVDF